MSIDPKTATVIVVEDNADNLFIVTDLLREDLRVKYCNGRASGRQFFKLLETNSQLKPDLILLDIQMPGMNGFEVCKKLKEIDQTRDIPVIFISALDEVLDKVEAFEVGGVDYITKPFQILEVLARIEHQLTLRRQHEQIAAIGALAHDLHDSIRQLVSHAELLTTGGDAPPSTELRTEIHQAAQKIEAAFVQLVRLTE